MATPVKLILTNEGALNVKYGADYQLHIVPAINALIASDKARGISSILLAIDDSATMQGVQGQPVTQHQNQQQNKRAVDAAFKHYTPDYVCILGSVDIVPHIHLNNPFSNDGDPDVPSDLPYACDRAFSKNITDFMSPTRLVGRIPDLTGTNNAKYLVDLLNGITKLVSLPATSFQNYLGITAQVWHQSSALSVTNLFGNANSLLDVPKQSPPWTNTLMNLSHFINCHGAPADSRFYGQQGGNFPVAHDASQLNGLVAGTVASVECCYGAELFDPSLNGGQPGICNTYLALGASAFWGSSNIAYGPASGNGQADLICQFFQKHILRGSSTGEAGLKARLDYIRQLSVASPADLKTLGQFHLMGDPSIFPVQLPTTTKAYKLSDKQKTFAIAQKADSTPNATVWTAEQGHLRKLGRALGAAVASVDLSSKTNPKDNIRTLLEKELSEHKAQVLDINAFDVKQPNNVLAKSKTFAAEKSFDRVYVAVGELPHDNAPFKRLIALVAKKQDDELIVETIFSR